MCVRVSMCVSVCARRGGGTGVCVCVRVRVCVCVSVWLRNRKLASLQTLLFERMCALLCTCMYVHMFACVHLCVYVCVCPCVYVFIQILSTKGDNSMLASLRTPQQGDKSKRWPGNYS
jgi:hypothetical protein